MDNLETPYEEGPEFIECGVCKVSVWGESAYKIHLTAPVHIKKENILAAQGLAVSQPTLPNFENILQYLEYMDLDEPIIGLDFLEEVPSRAPEDRLKYKCNICKSQPSDLHQTTLHVIGRKHRRNYVEKKRPDLVTWEKSLIVPPGSVTRARATIIERQDGRGTPTVLHRDRRSRNAMENHQPSRVPPRPMQNRDRNFPQGVMQQDVPSQPGRYPDIDNRHRHRQMSQWGDTLSQNHTKEELGRGDDREDMYRRDVEIPDYYHRDYEKEYVEDPTTRAPLAPGGAPRFDPRDDMPYGRARDVEFFPEEAPLVRGPTQERDQLEEYYSEEVRRDEHRNEGYQPKQPAYPSGHNQRWSLDRESAGQDSDGRAGGRGFGEPEAKRKCFSTPAGREQSCEHLFNVIKNYCDKMGERRQEGVVSNPEPSRARPSTSQRQEEMTGAMYDIPEPFRRFLRGGDQDARSGKRKRNRFSDATPEEMEMAKNMFNDKHETRNPQFCSHPRQNTVPLRPEIQGTQHPDIDIQSQNRRYTERYQRGGAENEDLFDILKNVEIENAEEADFLKDKLCNLLKEFKNKKSEKPGQNSHGRAGISHYNSSDTELSTRDQYERKFKIEDSDLRRPQNPYFEDEYRGRDEWQSGSRPPHDMHPNEPARYSERYEERVHPHDYRPAGQGFLDSYSSAPPLHTQRGSRMDWGPRENNNMDKITSTLLDLLPRK